MFEPGKCNHYVEVTKICSDHWKHIIIACIAYPNVKNSAFTFALWNNKVIDVQIALDKYDDDKCEWEGGCILNFIRYLDHVNIVASDIISNEFIVPIGAITSYSD